MMKWLGAVALGVLLGVAIIVGVAYYGYSRFFHKNHTETRVSRFSQAIFFSRVVKNFEFYTYEINFKSGKEMICSKPSLDEFWEIEYDRKKGKVISVFIFKKYLLRLQNDGKVTWGQGTETVYDCEFYLFREDFDNALIERNRLYGLHAQEINNAERRYSEQVEQKKKYAEAYPPEIPDRLKPVNPPIRSYEFPPEGSESSKFAPKPPSVTFQ